MAGHQGANTEGRSHTSHRPDDDLTRHRWRPKRAGTHPWADSRRAVACGEDTVSAKCAPPYLRCACAPLRSSSGIAASAGPLPRPRQATRHGQVRAVSRVPRGPCATLRSLAAPGCGCASAAWHTTPRAPVPALAVLARLRRCRAGRAGSACLRQRGAPVPSPPSRFRAGARGPQGPPRAQLPARPPSGAPRKNTPPHPKEKRRR